jgi:hypothetical protein
MRAQNPLAQRVLVIYDPAVPDSVTLANHYLASRGIPSANLCAISPPETALPLSWSAFVSVVQTPIQNCLNAVGPNQILYIVFSYIRPFSLIAQNGKTYAIDQYIADIWNQYGTTDEFPYPDQSQPYLQSIRPRETSTSRSSRWRITALSQAHSKFILSGASMARPSP